MGQGGRAEEDLGGYTPGEATGLGGGAGEGERNLEPSNLKNPSLALVCEPWQENTSLHPAASVVSPCF